MHPNEHPRTTEEMMMMMMMPPAPQQASSVTLSGLLNVLDGVRAAEGRILLMTSNNPDSLDKALVRAGRIDKKVLFDYASHEVVTKMFARIFRGGGQSRVAAEVARLAREFADQIPEGVITPAGIQCHLLTHRTDPVGAVAATRAFGKGVLEEKRKGTNVAGFESGVGARSDGAAVRETGVGGGVQSDSPSLESVNIEDRRDSKAEGS